jgi:glucosylglycerate phosphorylase
MREAISQLITKIYGPEQGPWLQEECLRLGLKYRGRLRSLPNTWSEQDVILITYADQFRDHRYPSHLQSLGHFYSQHFHKIINSIHFLPFFPSSSDDGFSVVDYLQIDPNCGNWDDVHQLAPRAKLMFDAVVNHCSQASPWFQAYLAGQPEFRDYFLAIEPHTDTSKVVRPRALP